MTFKPHSVLAFSLVVGLLTADRPARSVAQEPPRTDFYGDALPPGALARLGTVRWRPGEDVNFLTFADGGRLVVARGEDDGIFRVLEVAGGKELHRLGHSQRTPDHGALWETSSVLSPGGRFLASIGGKDQVLHIWEEPRAKVTVFATA